MARRLFAIVIAVAGCAASADAPSSSPTPSSSAPARERASSGATPPTGADRPRPDFVLLDFNVARNGARAMEGIVEVLRKAAPDVAVLQECDAASAEIITAKLGWRTVVDAKRLLVIAGPHPMTSLGTSPGVGRWGGMGATVDLGARGRVHVFDVHLDWQKYGPYLLEVDVENDTIVANERRVREHDLDALLKMMAPQLASNEPTFLAGDFNAPSHLDYDDIAWPTSVACRDHGLTDTYRTVNPRKPGERPPYAQTDPAVTWSPLWEAETKAFDRIDLVYFKGAVRPVSSVTLDARSGVDPWPSDHRAVLSGFDLP